ncbi:MAG: helix-turn-helix domain-containing protein [Candidatus Binatia bacterium]|nr:helix-turn-helix domain-containing protein [Candidatus Binatia bacterium]
MGGGAGTSADDGGAAPGYDLRSARAEFESRHIRFVLAARSGNVSRAAESLGLSRSMLQKKMKEYDLR